MFRMVMHRVMDMLRMDRLMMLHTVMAHRVICMLVLVLVIVVQGVGVLLVQVSVVWVVEVTCGMSVMIFDDMVAGQDGDDMVCMLVGVACRPVMVQMLMMTVMMIQDMM